jgi:Ca2+-dependent lipid-binding protein
MPGKLRVRIIAARNLPIMDRSSESSDAFVEVRFGNNYHDKTPVVRRSLDPEWNSVFVFEVEEDEIQEEPLQIRYVSENQSKLLVGN